MNLETRLKISATLKGIKKKPVSEETKMKLRLINLGKKYSPETIEKRASKMRGRVVSEETKLKISIARKNGRPSLPKGTYHHSEETRRKISESNKGQIRGAFQSSEYKERMRKLQTGKKYSLETRKKISEIVTKSYSEGVHTYKKSGCEKVIENLLQEKDLRYKYQYYIVRKGFCHAVDFFLLDYNIAIECDGDYWHGSSVMFKDENEIHKIRKITIREMREKDSYQTKFIEQLGIKMLRLPEWLIHTCLGDCEDLIDRYILDSHIMTNKVS